MGILIGMDEAGYGPSLGPLVVAATAWEVAEERGATNEEREGVVGVQGSAADSAISGTLWLPQSAIEAVDLYQLLRPVVGVTASRTRIAIADSKALYKPAKGLARLERGLHAVLAAMDQPASCWSAFVDSCCADPDEHHAHLCWHTGFNCQLPLETSLSELMRLRVRLQNQCRKVGVRPLAIRARFVFPAQFNDLNEQLGGKGAALSHVTIGLLREVMEAVQDAASPLADASLPLAPDLRPPTSTYVVCDKHGARNFYAALLQNFFPEHWITPVREGDAESLYEWGPAESRTRVVFRAKGEQFMPTALASMTAKYLRELSMRAFNEFWCARVEGLRPTAGYPVDARRFKREIAAAQRSLGIDDHVIWRPR